MDALEPHSSEIRLVLPVGLGAILAAAVSLGTCYAGIVGGAILGVQWFDLNPHVQAVLMWGFALVALWFLWTNRKKHGSNLPMGMAAFAVALLIGTLYIHYDQRLEAFAYVILVIAALVNQNIFLRSLNETVLAQADRIDGLNRRLSRTVETQQHEISRLGRLKEFLAPQVVDLIVKDGAEDLLKTHRRYIACLFCDIRNFTATSEAMEPEDIIEVLQTFHGKVGELAAARGGTIGFRAGDGVMVFFNDPLPCDAPVLEALRLAAEIRDAFDDVRRPWAALGHGLGVGFGVASGYATLGLVGQSGRADYTAIGNVVNLAARLCDEAKDGEILTDQRAYLDVESAVEAAPLGGLEMKGVGRPVEAFRVSAILAD